MPKLIVLVDGKEIIHETKLVHIPYNEEEKITVSDINKRYSTYQLMQQFSFDPVIALRMN